MADIEPTLLYRIPGYHKGPHGTTFDYEAVSTAEDRDRLLNEGWSPSLVEAVELHRADQPKPLAPKPPAPPPPAPATPVAPAAPATPVAPAAPPPAAPAPDTKGKK